MFLFKHLLIVIISAGIFQPGDGYKLDRQTGEGTAKNKTVEVGAANETASIPTPAAGAANSSIGVELVELVPGHKYGIDFDLANMMEMAQQMEMEQEMEEQLQFQPGMEFQQGFEHEGHHQVHINIDVD